MEDIIDPIFQNLSNRNPSSLAHLNLSDSGVNEAGWIPEIKNILNKK